MFAAGPAFSKAIAVALSRMVAVSLVSRKNKLSRLVRPAMSSPVTAFASPRSTNTDSLTPPIWTPPSRSSRHLVRNQNGKSMSRTSSGQSSSFICPHAAPSMPITVLNIGSPAAPARMNVVPSVPKNFCAASARSLPFIGATIALKLVIRNDAVCSGYIINCVSTLPPSPFINAGRAYSP